MIDILPFFLGFITVVIMFLASLLILSFISILCKSKDETSSDSPFSPDAWSKIIAQTVQSKKIVPFSRPLPLLEAMNYINLEEIEHD